MTNCITTLRGLHVKLRLHSALRFLNKPQASGSKGYVVRYPRNFLALRGFYSAYMDGTYIESNQSPCFHFTRASTASHEWRNLSYGMSLHGISSVFGSCVCRGTFMRDILPDREPQMLSECDAAWLEDSQGLTTTEHKRPPLWMLGREEVGVDILSFSTRWLMSLDMRVSRS